MRGEDCCQITYVIRTKETPPHAWGRHVEQRKELFTLRNTPTCVGKTVFTTERKRFNLKHPHMRGEDQATTAGNQYRPRNTPTCVGKTTFQRPCVAGIQKHPHMRGEDHVTEAVCRRNPETPPHAWGRPIAAPQQPALQRNTPTCVGKTAENSRTG